MQNNTRRWGEVGRISECVRRYDGDDIYWHMFHCGFGWRDAVEDYPDMSP